MVRPGNLAHHASFVWFVLAGDPDGTPTGSTVQGQAADPAGGLVSQDCPHLQRCVGVGALANLASGMFSIGHGTVGELKTPGDFTRSAAFSLVLHALKAWSG